jgi:hypothetical protein
MTVRITLSFLGLLLLLFACQEDPSTTPAEVVRLYQAYVDQNEFDKAGELSTPAERKRLQELAQMIAVDADSTILHTQFETINCQELDADTVKCDCLLEDQYERYEALFTLVRSGGDWLIDLPEEESVEYETEIEAVIDSLLRESLEQN